MKKIITLLLVLIFVVAIGGCRDAGSSSGAADTGSSADSGVADTGSGDEDMDDSDSDNMDDDDLYASDDDEDPNADDPEFEQTGTHDESVTISSVQSVPTVVADLGDLMTLEVFSEYVQDVHMWNEDLGVDSIVSRGNDRDMDSSIVVLEIEANEEGFFSVEDKNTGDVVMKIIIAGTSFT
jgi:hypothetical protein